MDRVVTMVEVVGTVEAETAMQAAAAMEVVVMGVAAMVAVGMGVPREVSQVTVDPAGLECLGGASGAMVVVMVAEEAACNRSERFAARVEPQI